GNPAGAGTPALVESQPLVPAISSGVKPPTLTPTIEFDNVSFAYPGGRRAAHEALSFRVAAGEKIGIVGPSGSGKSSVARLLLRLFDPQSGAGRIGGAGPRRLQSRVVRAQTPLLHQENSPLLG